MARPARRRAARLWGGSKMRKARSHRDEETSIPVSKDSGATRGKQQNGSARKQVSSSAQAL